MLWQSLCRDLKTASAGHRESGAFLLGNKNEGRVESYILYNELGSDCLFRGVIRVRGCHYGRLWKICRDRSQQVIADVHTHPGREFQSKVDKYNPMIDESGHIGLIIPFYASRNPTPFTTGFYQYLGKGHWRSVSMKNRRKTLLLTGG